MELISQAAFARMHEVSRKTVTVWKASGLIVMSGNAVDVEASNARLARYRPGRHTHGAKARLTPDALPTITPDQEIHSEGFHAGFTVALHEVAAAMPRLVADAARQCGERFADALDAAMRPLLLREFAEILCNWDIDASINATAFDSDALV